MQIVDSAILHPGVCAATGSAKGPFLDTQREDDYGNRIYLRVDWLREAGVFVGLGDPDRIREQGRRIAELTERVEELAEAEELLHDLRRSVRKTLLAGAVEVKDGNRELVKLRPVPGQPAVSLGEDD
jgi:hypothetical protein